MAIYNSFIECWNAWQLLALAPEDKQTSKVIDLPKWRPPLITFDWSVPILGRYTYITEPFYPSIRITKEMVDDMNATWQTENQAYVQFVFKNETALRFIILGGTGGKLSIYYQFVNLKTGVGGGISGVGLGYSYDGVFAEGQPALYLFPTMFHYKDSSDPSYNRREVWATLFYATEWGRIRENGGQPGDPRDWIPSVMLWGENDWQNVPDWFWEDNRVEVNPDYPEEEDDGDKGGFSNDDFGSDIIPIPDFPTVSALGSELVNVYTPSITDVKNFSNWLWSSGYETNVKKLQASPMENLITFGFVPNGADNNPISSVNDTIHIGGIDSAIATKSASTQYIEIDCGHIDVGEVHGSYLDYDTEFQIYLPYIGYKPLSVDDVLPNGINIKYHMDILTGIVQAYITGYVKDKTDNTYKLSLLYSYVGNCFTELPISGANYTRMKQGQMNAIVNTVSNFGTSVLKGDVFGATTSLINGKQQYDIQRPEFEHGGSLAGNVLFTFRKPYVIRTCYDYVPVEHYKSYKGVPCVTYHTLKNLVGFTQIDSVVTNTLTHCTNEEQMEIANLLKEGVYL